MPKLHPNKNRHGYLYVYHFSKKMRPRALSVHRLVARYFIPNQQNKPQVNHLDFDVTNNRHDNLTWATPLENITHSILAGRKTFLRGSECSRAVLDETTVREILFRRFSEGTEYKALASEYDTPYSTIAHIMRGTRWAHVFKSFIENPYA